MCAVQSCENKNNTLEATTLEREELQTCCFVVVFVHNGSAQPPLAFDSLSTCEVCVATVASARIYGYIVEITLVTMPELADLQVLSLYEDFTGMIRRIDRERENQSDVCDLERRCNPIHLRDCEESR